jgi:HpiC1 cyclase
MGTRLQISMIAFIVMTFGILPAHADLITNGSFETPIVTPGSFENFTTGSTSITGWTVVGAEASIVSGTFSQECCSFPAESGSQWLDLTGDGTNSDTQGVEQTVSTTSGTPYTLSFWVGNVYDPTGIFGTTSTVDVRLGGASGTLLGAFTNSSTTTGTQVWEQFTTTFTATGSSTTLDFLNGDPGNDNSNGLDNVSLNPSGTSPVPEPGAAPLVGVMMIVGLGLLRRRQAAAKSLRLP